jgi:hypothetical protein
VVDDVDHVMRRQPEVYRVEHRAVTRHTEVELQVAVVVEGHAGNPVAPLNAQRLKGVGELAGAPVAVGVGVPVDPLGEHGDYPFLEKYLADRNRNVLRSRGKSIMFAPLLYCIIVLQVYMHGSLRIKGFLCVKAAAGGRVLLRLSRAWVGRTGAFPCRKERGARGERK